MTLPPTLGSLDDDETKHQIIDDGKNGDDISHRLILDVGGYRFSTSLSTLKNLEPLSILPKFVSPPFCNAPEKDGSYFIDRNGAYFYIILEWLRDGIIPDLILTPQIVEPLIREAQFYNLVQLLGRLLQIQKEIEMKNNEDCKLKELNETKAKWLDTSQHLLLESLKNMTQVIITLNSKINHMHHRINQLETFSSHISSSPLISENFPKLPDYFNSKSELFNFNL